MWRAANLTQPGSTPGLASVVIAQWLERWSVEPKTRVQFPLVTPALVA